jgi:hypothetical protein
VRKEGVEEGVRGRRRGRKERGRKVSKIEEDIHENYWKKRNN